MMMRVLLFCLTILCANAVLVAAVGAQPLDSERILRDEFGFAQPMDAVRLRLPSSWQLNGAVQWEGRPECELERLKIHFMATAPDGKSWIEMIPGGVWGWSSLYDANPYMAQQGFSGCDARALTNIQAFVQAYVPTIRPNATIYNVQMRHDLIQQAVSQTDMRQGLTPQQRPRLEIAQVDIGYQAAGNTVYETLIPTILFIDQPGPDAYGGMNGYTTFAWAMGTVTMGNAAGHPNQALLKAVGDTVEFLPQYQQQVTQHLRQRSQMLAQAHARKRAAQQAWLANRRSAHAAAQSSFDATQENYTRSSNDVLDIGHQTYRNTTDMRDAGHAKSVDGIHERTPWLNTEGKTIYMPQEYQRVYQLPNGVYAGTNDAFFNPVATFGEFGTPLQQQR